MIGEILQNCETTLENVKHVFYSNCNNDTLFISFAGRTERYVSVTWFYNQSDFLGNFLFLKNDENFNTFNEEKYEKLINYYIQKLNIKKLISYGVSMGGIASIKYGLKYNADVIISIDPEPIHYDYKELLQEIKFYNNNYDFKNKIYINYTFLDDCQTIPQWTEDIIKELQKKNMIIILHPFLDTHHLAFIPSKEYLMEIIDTMSKLNVKRYDDFGKWF
jgi:pimeloyl-ACP methyl ester carboxylesterase